MKTKKPTVLKANQGESVSVVGDRYTFLTTKEQTEGTFAQMEFYIPPGGGSPPHTHHNEDEFFYIVEGELEFHIDGNQVIAKEGDFLFGPKGVPHNFKNVTEVPVVMICTVMPAGLEDYFRGVGIPLPSRDSQPIPPTKEDKNKMIALASKYGLEINFLNY